MSDCPASNGCRTARAAAQCLTVLHPMGAGLHEQRHNVLWVPYCTRHPQSGKAALSHKQKTFMGRPRLCRTMHTTLGSSPLIDCPRARKVDRQLLQSHTCLGGKQQPSRQGVQAVSLSVGNGGTFMGPSGFLGGHPRTQPVRSSGWARMVTGYSGDTAMERAGTPFHRSASCGERTARGVIGL